MAGVWHAQRLVVAVVVMVVPALVHAQVSNTSKNIAKPDFPCGQPYGPNGEPPSPGRVRRQIIFPDEPIYKKYWGMIKLKSIKKPDIRGSEIPTDVPPEEEFTFCGASVISDRFIVTAAHCVFDEENLLDSVRLGDLDLSVEGEPNSKPVDHEIELIIVHPEYQPDTFVRYNDVALLKTREKIQFNDVVFPYCISDTPPAPGTIVTASGYGLFNATTQPDHLLEANFTVIDTAECEDIYIREGLDASLRIRYPNLLQGSDIICATDKISDACQGDSGGPVYREKDGKLFLEGVVSGGASCRSNFNSVLPGLYLTLAKHVDFINDSINKPFNT